jgi:hypothetical protein
VSDALVVREPILAFLAPLDAGTIVTGFDTADAAGVSAKAEGASTAEAVGGGCGSTIAGSSMDSPDAEGALDAGGSAPARAADFGADGKSHEAKVPHPTSRMVMPTIVRRERRCFFCGPDAAAR